jgi:hypothetical protein
VGNQSAAVNMSVAAGNVAVKLRKTIEVELDQVDIVEFRRMLLMIN